jgi:hypothetical protein
VSSYYEPYDIAANGIGSTSAIVIFEIFNAFLKKRSN